MDKEKLRSLSLQLFLNISGGFKKKSFRIYFKLTGCLYLPRQSASSEVSFSCCDEKYERICFGFTGFSNRVFFERARYRSLSLASRPEMLCRRCKTPLRAMEIVPVSSDTTIIMASEFSLKPKAARCLVPSTFESSFCSVSGNTPAASSMRLLEISTAPSCRSVLSKKIVSKSSFVHRPHGCSRRTSRWRGR